MYQAFDQNFVDLSVHIIIVKTLINMYDKPLNQFYNENYNLDLPHNLLLIKYHLILGN
jgi:hypothetical protein